MPHPRESVSLGTFLWHGRVLLWTATIVVPLAVAMAPFVAFGIVMTPQDTDDLVVTNYAVLWPLGMALFLAVCSLGAAWWFAWSAPSRAATASRSVFAIIALASGMAVMVGLV